RFAIRAIGHLEHHTIGVVAQLAHVTWPGVLEEPRLDGACDRGRRSLKTLCPLRQEMAEQRHDVAAPLSQRRDSHAYDVEPEEQIGPEQRACGHLAEIHFGG